MKTISHTLCGVMVMGALTILAPLSSPSHATHSQAEDVYLGQNINSSPNNAQNHAVCHQHFYDSIPPALQGTRGNKLRVNTYELCFHGFAVLYSGVSRTPLWSAEHLTAERITQARQMGREDSFREEMRLPVSARSTLSDYNRSGYDRGHLAPNGDMASKSEQFDSFSLANIAPQNGNHNRNLWRHIETTTRQLAIDHGQIYVITGVVFEGDTLVSIGTGVLVPSHFYKAIYIPSLGSAGVYYSPNDAVPSHEIISLSELSKRTGIDVMPNLAQTIKDTPFALPYPSDQKDKKIMADANGTDWLSFGKSIMRYLWGLLQS